MSDDYGYFEKGSTGYAYYNTAVENSKKAINGSNGVGGCLTAAIMIISETATDIAIFFMCIFEG